jgi:uncharacterized protein involved in response to NO
MAEMKPWPQHGGMAIQSETNLPAPALRLLAEAPHRLLFFVGASNVLLAMGWWTLWLINARWPVWAMPQPAIPAGWMHAFVMQYQVLPTFMFGFLLTVFPRWMGLPALTRWHYLPVGFGLLGGQALTLVGLFGIPHLLFLGLLQTLAGWIAGYALLLNLLWREQKQTTWHAVSCVGALTMGLVGLGLVFAYEYTGNLRLMFAAIKFGSFGLLLPIYFTVSHRMFTFFAGNVVKDYQPWRPLPLLAAFWLLNMAHLGLELVHGYAWLWLADLPMLLVTGVWLWRNWPGGQSPPLLRVLFLGFAWLPLAMALYSLQSLWFALGGNFILGRAPAHALFIGFFGSLLVAMVTRVTQGHSGRPLQLGRVAGFAFALMQLVAIVRIVAELTSDPMKWQVIAGLGWLLAFLPWALRSGWIYLSPRVDGKPG